MQLPFRVRRLPSGLHVPMRAGFRGEVRWRVLDERGVPEIPRNPSGFAVAPIEGVRQPNVITDLGLDRMAVTNVMRPSVGNQLWRNYLLVGTGSTAPATTDVALAAYVQRSNAGGLASEASTFNLDTTNNVFAMQNMTSKALTLSAPQNLTEFGFSDVNSTDALIRELFRDEFGTPITISLLAGKIIDVQHTLFGEIAAPTAGVAGTFDLEQYDATNTLVSTTPYSYTHGPRVATADTGPITFLFNLWSPASSSVGSLSQTVAGVSGATAYARVGGLSVVGGTNAYTSGALDAYIGSSLQRTWRATIPTQNAVGTWSGINFGFSNAAPVCWHVAFDSPATYVKPNTDTLAVNFTSTWGRI